MPAEHGMGNGEEIAFVKEKSVTACFRDHGARKGNKKGKALQVAFPCFFCELSNSGLEIGLKGQVKLIGAFKGRHAHLVKDGH